MGVEAEERIAEAGQKFSVMELISRAKPSPDGVEGEEEAIGAEGMPALDKLSPLPLPSDPYTPHSLATTQPQPMLCLLFRGVGFKCLSYGNLESVDYEQPKEQGKRPVLILLFAGICPLAVKIEGTELRKLGNLLRLHRIGWLREHPTGKVAEDESGTVITRFTVTPVER